MSQLIHGFKYHQQLSDGSLLCQLLCERIEEHYLPGTLPAQLIAVPNHWQRQLRRGYSQTAWLTRQLSHNLAIPQVAPLKRQRRHPQQGLKRAERLRNLRHSFHCFDLAAIADRHIALVDDVVTTGATVSTISALLRDSGAARVDVWSLARTPKPHH